MPVIKCKSVCKVILAIYCLNFLQTGLQAGIATSDTINLRAGECYTLEQGDKDRRPFIWTTGNQDIANIESVFGTPKLCAVFEGITYVSGTTIKGASQKRFYVRVTGGSDSDKATTTKTFHHRNSIDSDIQDVLNMIEGMDPDMDIDTRVEVSDNRRGLVFRGTHKPFLLLSQTLWSMTRRLSREQIIQVLDICKEQGFTAIQLIAHSHYMGPNIYGKTPFENENFLRPLITPGNNPDNHEEYDWWDHLEFIVSECIKREMFICLLPTWREQWNHNKNLHENNAFAYGKFIGQRYRRYNPWIIWVMGGDEAPDTPVKLQIHHELAKGITWGINSKEDYSNVLMTYHSHGPTSTTDYIPENEPFMDFNTIQSGHDINNLEDMIEKSYKAHNKPVMDFEPYYSRDGKTTNEARTAIYWGIFSGGFGTSFGSWNIWHCGARNDLAEFSIPDSFFEGFGTQINYLRELITEKPLLSCLPNQTFLIYNNTGLDRILAMTAFDRSFAMVYTPHGEPFVPDLRMLNGKRICWYWFNPGNGEKNDRTFIRRTNRPIKFVPPSSGPRFSGNDWVLIIENGRKKMKLTK